MNSEEVKNFLIWCLENDKPLMRLKDKADKKSVDINNLDFSESSVLNIIMEHLAQELVNNIFKKYDTVFEVFEKYLMKVSEEVDLPVFAFEVGKILELKNQILGKGK